MFLDILDAHIVETLGRTHGAEEHKQGRQGGQACILHALLLRALDVSCAQVQVHLYLSQELLPGHLTFSSVPTLESLLHEVYV
jgi:hypothetical protein